GPDLRLKYATGCLEDANHRPSRGREPDGRADLQTLKFAQQAFADHDLVSSRIEHPPLDELNAFANGGPLLADPTQWQVRLGSGRALYAIDNQIKLSRRQRLAIDAAGNARPLFDEAHLIARNGAVDLGLRPAAQHDGHFVFARTRKRALKSV